MSQFPPDTILTRIDPRGDAFDRLRVVGPSPVAQPSVGEWEGAGGEAVIVTPADEFGANEIMPVTYAVVKYKPTFPPTNAERYAEEAARRQATNMDVTPEQAFATDHAIKAERAAEQARKIQEEADRVAAEQKLAAQNQAKPKPKAKS